MPQSADWKILIHGGAGVIERDQLDEAKEAEIRAGLQRALDSGASVLAGGGSAVDAVEAAVKALEDDGNFTAGHGAVLTYEGATELDDAIMDGRTRDAGAASGVSATRNPVSLARAVMEKSPHVMLAGSGADTFSREQGLEQAAADYFPTPERYTALEAMKANGGDWFDVDMKYGTVGAVALDSDGHVAAATSTGGITGKRWGRVGDTPIIGAGTFADDRSCAVSATGSGEYFIRAVIAHEIGARIRLSGESAATAAAAVMEELGAMGGSGGVIVVTPGGEAEWAFNSSGMYRGRASAEGSTVAIFGE